MDKTYCSESLHVCSPENIWKKLLLNVEPAEASLLRLLVHGLVVLLAAGGSRVAVGGSRGGCVLAVSRSVEVLADGRLSRFSHLSKEQKFQFLIKG